MSKLKELARGLGVTTADRIAAPLPKPKADAHARQRDRWPATKKLAFKTLNPAALVLVGTDGPVSVTIDDRERGETRRLGHNRGIWPMKLALTTSWKDTVTTAYDKNPLFYVGTQFRVWVPSAKHRAKLAETVLERLAARAEADGGIDTLRAGFRDLGPEIDLALFEMEIHGLAKGLGIATWDDAGLSLFLDRMCARAEQVARDRGRRMSEQLLEAVMVKGIEEGLRG